MKSRDEKTIEDRKSSNVRIHRTRSPDDTEIAGRVHGQGPSLVFFHGGMTDGEHAWNGMLPHLTEHFTCYLQNMRGTGLSEDHNDLRPERHAEDLAAFIDSVGEPVGLFGHSSGGTFGFGAVQREANVAAMATYEPAVFELWEEGEDAEHFQKAVGNMAQAAGESHLTDGVRELLSVFANDNEVSVMEDEGHFDMLVFSSDTKNNVDYDICDKFYRNCWFTGNTRVTEAGRPISCGCAQTATGD